jgi:hypothetical protein
MSDLRDAAEQAVEMLASLHAELRWDLDSSEFKYLRKAEDDLKAALEQPERTLTDEKIADLWHQNGGFHHHFARAVERYLKGEK